MTESRKSCCDLLSLHQVTCHTKSGSMSNLHGRHPRERQQAPSWVVQTGQGAARVLSRRARGTCRRRARGTGAQQEPHIPFQIPPAQPRPHLYRPFAQRLWAGSPAGTSPRTRGGRRVETSGPEAQRRQAPRGGPRALTWPAAVPGRWLPWPEC